MQNEYKSANNNYYGHKGFGQDIFLNMLSLVKYNFLKFEINAQTGITILGILTTVVGAIELGVTILMYFEPNAFGSSLLFILHLLVGGFSFNVADGAVFMVQGAVGILVGYWTLKRYNTAWTANIVFAIYRAVFGLGWMPPFFPLIINGIILYFILQPNVKILFRYTSSNGRSFKV